MTEDSYIQHNSGSVSFVGSDAVRAYQALVLVSALKLASRGIKANRHCTPTKLLASATVITGKAYKRGELLKAAEDVQHWAKTMRMALPQTESEI